ncbi:hypothetical protein H0H93_013013 [Arthromyces matolae]|nr:hypothetical protein H0H93_013013 [Arthromyces matolae]
MTKSRSSDVQIAAAAHILRALPRQQQDESSTRLVMNTLNRMIASPLSPSEELGLPHHSSYSLGSGGDSVGAGGAVGMIGQRQIDHLVSDDASLCQAAFDRGCLAQLVGLVSALPLPPTPSSLLAEVESLSILNGPGVDVSEGGGMRAGAISGGDGGGGARVKGGIRVYVPPPEDDNKMEEDEDWCEPEGRALLREAALTAIAAISLFDNDVRRSLAEPNIYPSYHQHTSSAPFPPHASSSSLSPPPTSNSNSSPAPLIPVLLAGIVHPSAGVRYASCQCVRAMSRAVAVLRTNIVDSGLGIGVWRRCVKGPTDRRKHPDETITPSRDKVKEQWEGEKDTRVLLAGLAVVCNLVNDFSPLRSVLLEDGLVERLREILDMGVSEDQMEDEQQSEPGGEGEVKQCSTENAQLKISALWAVKNLLFKSELNLKSRVMNVIGWDKIARFLGDYDTGIREQALNVLRNVTENEPGVDLVNKEIGEDKLLDHVANALKSTNDDIVLQAAYLLGNLANAKASHLAQILSHPRLLPALHTALVAATITVSSSHSPSSMTPSATLSSSNHVAQSYRAQARGPLVSCVAQLAAGGAAQVKAAGFEGALKHVVEWTGGGLGGGRGTHGGWDDDRQVALEARNALMLIEK